METLTSAPICTDPAYWCGVIQEPPTPGIDESGIIRATKPCNAFMDWFPYMRPSINQKGESCVGWSWAHWYTAMRVRIGDDQPFEDGWHLDGHQIWMRGREMFWGGALDGGLYLPQGSRAMADLGIIPASSRVMQVAPDWDSVGEALLEAPIVQGHAIHEGWFRPNKQNGCLDHAPVANGAQGYHATCRVARLVQGEGQRFYVLQNSWGELWGFWGYGVMSESEDREGIMHPGLHTCRMPDNWMADPTWRKYLKKA